jgi:hypothetical protein
MIPAHSRARGPPTFKLLSWPTNTQASWHWPRQVPRPFYLDPGPRQQPGVRAPHRDRVTPVGPDAPFPGRPMKRWSQGELEGAASRPQQQSSLIKDGSFLGPSCRAPCTVVLAGGLTTLILVFRRWLQKSQHHKPTYVDKDR